MRVAVGKVSGVESVDVTLKRGVAHIRMREANAVSLADLRRIIKDAGYTSREATITAQGQLVREGRGLSLLVSGSGERFDLVPSPSSAVALEQAASSASVEIVGVIAPPEGRSPRRETVRVTSLTLRP